MYNLIAFFRRYSFFFQFLLLEVVAILLLANRNYYQRSKITGAANQLIGNVFNVYSGVTDYFSLQKANETLAWENAMYRELRQESLITIDTSRLVIEDTLSQQAFEYIPAKVISNSTHKVDNYIMLNKGLNHGIETDMGVIAPNGIVGSVIQVSENFSWVMPVLHSQSRVSAKIKKNNHLGSLKRSETDYRFGYLDNIPGHVIVNKGDTIVTSGFSHMFPENISVGIAESASIEDGGDFKRVKVFYTVDYNMISYVYVVRNLFKEEQLELSESIIE